MRRSVSLDQTKIFLKVYGANFEFRNEPLS